MNGFRYTKINNGQREHENSKQKILNKLNSNQTLISPQLKSNLGLYWTRVHLQRCSEIHKFIQEFMNDSRRTSNDLHAIQAAVNVSVHDSTIKNRLGKGGIHERKHSVRQICNNRGNQEMGQILFHSTVCEMCQIYFQQGLCGSNYKLVFFLNQQ